jgi:hypothetical protein
MATLTQTMPATELRGKRIRLSGQVRANSAEWEGVAALRLTVDRGDRGDGFWDNMWDRPIRERSWQAYTIEGYVADDAVNVSVGITASGAVVADFDALNLEVEQRSGGWTPVPLEDAGFEAPGPEGVWKRLTNPKHLIISRPAAQAPEGSRFLRLAPPAFGTPEAEALEADGRELFGTAWVPIAGAHADISLGRRVIARVRLSLTDAEARATTEQASAALEALRQSLRSIPAPSATPDVDARLADVLVAWNLFRHFYPYWSDVDVNWDSRLRTHLEAAYQAQTRHDEKDALRLLIADARDGHGHVLDSLQPDDRWPDDRPQVPVRFGFVNGRIAVTATADPDHAPMGSLVSGIDGVPAVERFKSERKFVSGSEQWKTVTTFIQIAKCTHGPTLRIVLDSGSGPKELDFECRAIEPDMFPLGPPTDKRPEAIAALTPNIWYVDLTTRPHARLDAKDRQARFRNRCSV